MESDGINNIVNPDYDDERLGEQQRPSAFPLSGCNLHGSTSHELSWKLSTPVSCHDPSYSGELDPYTVIILSQL